MNLGSAAQLQHFFFGKYVKKVFQSDEVEKVFKLEKSDDELALQTQQALNRNAYVNTTIDGMKQLMKERGVKGVRGNSRKNDLLHALLLYDRYQQRSIDLNLPSYDDINIPTATTSSTAVIDEGTSQINENTSNNNNNNNNDKEASSPPVKKPKKAKTPKVVIKPLTYFEKQLAVLRSHLHCTDDAITTLQHEDDAVIDSILSASEKVKSFKEFRVKSLCMTPEEFTPGGSPQVSTSVLRKLAGKNLYDDKEDNRKWGTAFEFFGANDNAKEACLAINALADIGGWVVTINSDSLSVRYLIFDCTF